MSLSLEATASPAGSKTIINGADVFVQVNMQARFVDPAAFLQFAAPLAFTEPVYFSLDYGFNSLSQPAVNKKFYLTGAAFPFTLPRGQWTFWATYYHTPNATWYMAKTQIDTSLLYYDGSKTPVITGKTASSISISAKIGDTIRVYRHNQMKDSAYPAETVHPDFVFNGVNYKRSVGSSYDTVPVYTQTINSATHTITGLSSGKYVVTAQHATNGLNPYKESFGMCEVDLATSTETMRSVFCTLSDSGIRRIEGGIKQSKFNTVPNVSSGILVSAISSNFGASASGVWLNIGRNTIYIKDTSINNSFGENPIYTDTIEVQDVEGVVTYNNFTSLQNAIDKKNEFYIKKATYYTEGNLYSKIWLNTVIGDCNYAPDGFYSFFTENKAIQVVNGSIVNLLQIAPSNSGTNTTNGSGGTSGGGGVQATANGIYTRILEPLAGGAIKRLNADGTTLKILMDISLTDLAQGKITDTVWDSYQNVGFTKKWKYGGSGIWNTTPLTNVNIPQGLRGKPISIKVGFFQNGVAYPKVKNMVKTIFISQ